MSKPIFYVIFLQALFASFLHAEELKAQKSVYEIEVSIHVKNASVIDVFREIEAKTDFLFTYNDSFIDEKRVSLNVRNKSVGYILEHLSEVTQLQFKRVNDNIHVQLREEGEPVYEKYEEQEFTVSGTVKDENGEGLPGVNVIVKGTTRGTVTGIDGTFKLAASETDILVFSSVGFTVKEIAVNGQTVIDVSMSYDVQSLTEVVVTGYSSQRQRDITGAVAVVKVDELQIVQAASISQKLEGRASGVTMTTSGEPGEGTNIMIRGIGSFSQGSDPLWIIDGVQSTDKSNTWLNPNDIESIQVLKDASSASIYGARAANGVIIVTTKKGKAGKTRVTYDGYAGVQHAIGGYDDIIIRDPLQMAEATRQFYANSSFGGIPTDNYYHQYELNGQLPQYTWPIANLAADGNTLVNPVTGAPITTLGDYQYFDNLIMGSNPTGTNWWDELFQPATMMEHNVGVSGGTDNSTFNFSAGYLKQDGTMIHTGFERFSMRANSQFKAGKLTIGENITFAHTDRIAQIGSNQDNQNAITMTLLQHSITPVYDIQGNFAGAKALSNGGNPIAQQVRNKDNGSTTFKTLGNAFAEFAITDWLKVKSNFGFDFQNSVFTQFNFPTPENREPTLNNRFFERWDRSFTWIFTNTMEFNKKIGDQHSINAYVGYEAFRNQYRGMQGALSNYFTDNINAWYLNAGIGDPASRNVSSFGGPSSILSSFAKADYVYGDRYILNATIRRDGSSSFGAAQRWAVFPAVSLGWRVSEEAFMSGVSIIDDLKFRVGYGVTGSQNIPGGNPFDRFGGGPGSTFYDLTGSNSSVVTGYALQNRGNINTKWESNYTTNAGLDMSLLEGQLTVVVDVYKREIDGLLYAPRVTGTQGSAAPPFANIGKMENKGIDVSLGYRGTISNDLSFNTTLNLSHYKNEVLFVSEDIDFFYSTGADGHANYVINQVGYPMASFYGYRYLGVVRSEEEATSIPAQIGGTRAGGWKFADLDGDNAIDPDDREVIGSPHPDLTLGLNLGLTYKTFDFNMFLFASIGNEIYNYQKYYYETGRWGSMFSKEMLTDSWTPERPNARLPQLNVDNSNAADVASSYYLENGSYLRARTIQFGYNLPGAALKRIGVGSLRIYVQGQNLFTITGYSGVEPVLSNVDIGDGNANDQYLGTDLGSYPNPKIYSLGVNASF